MDKLIEVRTVKATLFLTEEEFINGLKRGKAIARSRKQKDRERQKGLEHVGSIMDRMFRQE